MSELSRVHEDQGSTTRTALPYRDHAALLAFLHKAEVDAIFSQFPVQLRDQLPLTEVLRRARSARQSLPGWSPGAPEPLPPSLAEAAAEVQRRESFVRNYQAKADLEFASFPIASLLSPQWQADLDYVAELAATLPPDENPAVDFAFAFPTGRPPEPMIMGNTVVFSSHAPNIAMSPVPSIRPTADGYEIAYRAESRPNFVMIAEFGGRLILQNGVHHVLALRSRRRSHVFGLLSRAQRPEELGLNMASTLFAPVTYFQASRPPLVIDFDGPAAVRIMWRAVNHLTQAVMQVNTTQFPVVLGPQHDAAAGLTSAA